MASEYTPFIDEMKKIRKEFKRKRREEMANEKDESTDLLGAMENAQIQDKAESYRNASVTLHPNDNDHEGILDIHSGYGFDYDTPEFEAHRKKYFEENPNTTSYPADHFDKLLSGELDGSAKDNPFVEPVSPDIKENKDD